MVEFAGGLSLGPVSAKMTVAGPAAAEGDAQAALLRRVVRHLEREVSRLSRADLSPGEWMFFDLSMTYGTSYRDTGPRPAIDDVALFAGSFALAGPEEGRQSAT